MIDVSEIGPFEPVFSHVEPDGTNTHIASERLRLWVEANSAKLVWRSIPIEARVLQQFERAKCIDLARALELAQRIGFEPIIYGLDGTFTDGKPDAFLIDGHHRYMAQALRGGKFISAYLLELAQWQQFQITGLGELSQAQLAAMRIAHGGSMERPKRERTDE